MKENKTGVHVRFDRHVAYHARRNKVIDLKNELGENVHTFWSGGGSVVVYNRYYRVRVDAEGPIDIQMHDKLKELADQSDLPELKWADDLNPSEKNKNSDIILKGCFEVIEKYISSHICPKNTLQAYDDLRDKLLK